MPLLFCNAMVAAVHGFPLHNLHCHFSDFCNDSFIYLYRLSYNSSHTACQLSSVLCIYATERCAYVMSLHCSLPYVLLSICLHYWICVVLMLFSACCVCISTNFDSVYFTAKMLAATDRPELLCRQSNIQSIAWCNTKKKVTLSGTRCPAHGVMVGCYGCYANGWRFYSHLAVFRFFFSLLFFRLRLGVTFTG